MATPAQIEANRRNAQRSTGPRSVEGKAVSRFNALKSGIDAKSLVIPGEDPAELEALVANYYLQFPAATPVEAFGGCHHSGRLAASPPAQGGSRALAAAICRRRWPARETADAPASPHRRGRTLLLPCAQGIAGPDRRSRPSQGRSRIRSGYGCCARIGFAPPPRRSARVGGDVSIRVRPTSRPENSSSIRDPHQ